MFESELTAKVLLKIFFCTHVYMYIYIIYNIYIYKVFKIYAKIEDVGLTEH